LPDADAYGDEGTNTLGHLARAVGGLELPTLERLGLGSILALEGVPPAAQPVLHGRLRPPGPGKDSTAGHWELLGVVAPRQLPVYPMGFPPEVISLVSAASGREVICNRPYNGVGAIEDFGSQHLSNGALIVYTSQDSVLQIAAHVEAMAPEELYRVCETVRESLDGEHGSGASSPGPSPARPGTSPAPTAGATSRSRRQARAIWRPSPPVESRSTPSARRGSCFAASVSTSSIRVPPTGRRCRALAG
jgi:phosphopentomutase